MTTISEQLASGDRSRIDLLEVELRTLRVEQAVLRAQFVALMETNRYRDLILKRHAPTLEPAPTTVRLEAQDFAEDGNGLYYLEYGSAGEAYRWTGPGHTMRVRFNVDRSAPVWVTFRLVSLGNHTERDEITVSVDGNTYPMRMVPADGIVLQAGPVAPRATPDTTELLFNLPVTFSPNGSDGQDDARQLGVAMKSVEVGPAA